MPAPVVSDIPQSSASGMPRAWKNSITSGGVGAAPTLQASTASRPEVRAEAREDLLVGGLDARRELGRDLVAALLEPDLLERRGERLLACGPLLGGRRGQHLLEARP